jgi:hypothetical protein
MTHSIGFAWRRAVIIAGGVIGFGMGVWIDYALGWSTTTIGLHIGGPPPPTLADYVTSFFYLTLGSTLSRCLLSRAMIWVTEDLATSLIREVTRTCLATSERQVRVTSRETMNQGGQFTGGVAVATVADGFTL